MGLAVARFFSPALTLCHSATPGMRALAATLLGALGGREGVEVLTALLNDDVPEVRTAAARALGKLRYWPAAAALATLLRDRAWDVRREVGLALRSLNQSTGDSYTRLHRYGDITHLHGLPSVPMSCGSI